MHALEIENIYDFQNERHSVVPKTQDKFYLFLKEIIFNSDFIYANKGFNLYRFLK